MITFKVGDGAQFRLGSDTYPMTIRRVERNGKTIYASRDKARTATGPANRDTDRGVRMVFIPQDEPEQEWEKVAAAIARALRGPS